MKFPLSAVRATLLTATALGCVVAACIGAPQAQAQFVCIGNATGAPVPPGAANGDGANIVTGISTMACGTLATAVGDFATATSANATAIGLAATATGENSLANGTRANATGAGSIANGQNATAIGTRSTANGTNATALGGPGTLANADAATAVGQGATVAAGATGGSAFGQGATVSGANGTAIGAGAVTTAPNQMVFGTASSTYVAPGITSAASKAAQSGPLQIVTSDASGNLATNTAAGLGLASSTDISAINSQLTGINAHLNDLDSRTTKALNVAAPDRALRGDHGLGHLPGHQRPRAQCRHAARHQRAGQWRRCLWRERRGNRRAPRSAGGLVKLNY